MNGETYIGRAISELEAYAAKCTAIAQSLREIAADVQAGSPGKPRRTVKGAEVARRATKIRNVRAAAHPTGRVKVTDDQVAAAVAGSGGLTNREVASKLGVSEGTTWHRLAALVDAGVLTRGADNKYRRVVKS